MDREKVKKYIRETAKFVTYLQNYIKKYRERKIRGFVTTDITLPLINSLEVVKIRLRKLEDWVDGFGGEAS